MDEKLNKLTSTNLIQSTKETHSSLKEAIFAAGCFWGVEYMFRKIVGVNDVICGYTGGFVENPTYQQVCTGKTGHAEAVLVIYDPNIVGYEELVRYFFEIHDPTQIGGQGPDIGEQYRSEIFYLNEEQKTIAEKIIKELIEKGINVVTKVTKASNFYKAEDYHQNYYDKTKEAPYCHFRRNVFNADYIKVII